MIQPNRNTGAGAGVRIFLTCTPRTGNTWFRRLLAGALKMPGLAAHNPGEIAWTQLPPNCLVAMHWSRGEEFKNFLTDYGFRTLVTTRHPLDVLISILHFSQHEPATDRWLEGECGNERVLEGATPTSQAFADYCLGRRAARLLQVSVEWLKTAETVVKYEDLLHGPVAELRRVLAYFGAGFETRVETVVEENRIEKLRGFSVHHFWRGQAGLWKRLIDRELATAIYRRHREVFDTFGYGCESAAVLCPEQIDRVWRELNQPQVVAP